MEEHTLLNHYRVEDPRILYQISSMDGTEVDVDDDEQGGLVTIDVITHRQTAEQLKKMAAAGQIRAVAGETTRDMTGKARPVGTQYEPTQREWSEKDDAWSYVYNLESKLKPEIKKLIERLVGDKFEDPLAANQKYIEPSMKVAVAQILLDLAREYDPK